MLFPNAVFLDDEEGGQAELREVLRQLEIRGQDQVTAATSHDHQVKESSKSVRRAYKVWMRVHYTQLMQAILLREILTRFVQKNTAKEWYDFFYQNGIPSTYWSIQKHGQKHISAKAVHDEISQLLAEQLADDSSAKHGGNRSFPFGTCDDAQPTWKQTITWFSLWIPQEHFAHLMTFFHLLLLRNVCLGKWVTISLAWAMKRSQNPPKRNRVMLPWRTCVQLWCLSVSINAQQSPRFFPAAWG